MIQNGLRLVKQLVLLSQRKIINNFIHSFIEILLYLNMYSDFSNSRERVSTFILSSYIQNVHSPILIIQSFNNKYFPSTFINVKDISISSLSLCSKSINNLSIEPSVRIFSMYSNDGCVFLRVFIDGCFVCLIVEPGIQSGLLTKWTESINSQNTLLTYIWNMLQVSAIAIIIHILYKRMASSKLKFKSNTLQTLS